MSNPTPQVIADKKEDRNPYPKDGERVVTDAGKVVKPFTEHTAK